MVRMLVFVVASAVAGGVGIAEASQVCLAPAVAFGAKPAPDLRRIGAVQARTDESGDVLFTVALASGEVTVTAEGGGVRFEKVTSDAGIRVRIEAEGDTFEFGSDTAGRVRVARGRKAYRLRGDVLNGSDQRKLAEIAGESPALRRFDLLAAAIADSNRREAESVLITHAFIRSLQGDTLPSRALGRKIAERAARGRVRAGFRIAGGPAECWEEYERTVNRYLYEYEECMMRSRWNPFNNYACSSVWALKAELAFFWVISCSGGIPG